MVYFHKIVFNKKRKRTKNTYTRRRITYMKTTISSVRCDAENNLTRNGCVTKTE